MQTTLPNLLTPRDVALWLRTSAPRVKSMAKKRQIPFIDLPTGEIVFDETSLLTWLHNKSQSNSPVATQ